MSELKVIDLGNIRESIEKGESVYYEYYVKSEADKVIADLKEEIDNIKYSRDEWAKACNQKDKEIEELKQKLEDAKATAYAESVDAGMRERRLKRALWIARAWFCGRSCEYFSGMASRCKIGQEDFYSEVSERARRYMASSYKCRAKAEEYK